MTQQKPEKRRPLEKRVVQKADGRYLILYSRPVQPPPEPRKRPSR